MEQSIIFQRVEALVLFVLALALYWWLGSAWWIFLVLFLCIDITMVGYLFNTTTGAFIYNVGHTFIIPSGFLLYGTFYQQETAIAFALIWLAHIGFDRAMGYGLKMSNGFGHTHLGKIGKVEREE
jgi:hypothetical protein